MPTESLTDGEILWVMLHEDNGTKNDYEFDGQNGLDGPYYSEAGEIAITPIVVSSASIEVTDQKIIGNTVTIDKVTAARDGWSFTMMTDPEASFCRKSLVKYKYLRAPRKM